MSPSADTELEQRLHERNAGTIFCLGFHHWKKNYVRAYLRAPGNQVHFVRSARHAERLGFGKSSHLLVWGQRKRAEAARLSERHGVPIWCMEDGFLRSVGLGFDPTMPASLVVDREGIYYDPTGPSEL
ncbi:MAG TPA: hypothetical protein VL172_20735, partial [Kofleriaceae bacterium]|nr:hypothetical protein [Kofleriaceae bacterium]